MDKIRISYGLFFFLGIFTTTASLQVELAVEPISPPSHTNSLMTSHSQAQLSELLNSPIPELVPTVPVLLCDGCGQPVATAWSIINTVDDQVKPNPENTFLYKLHGLFQAPSVPMPPAKRRHAEAAASHHQDPQSSSWSSTNAPSAAKKVFEPTANQAPFTAAAPTSPASTADSDDYEENDGFWAYSALNPDQQRFDMIRVQTFLTLPPMGTPDPSDGDKPSEEEEACTPRSSKSADHGPSIYPFQFTSTYSSKHSFFLEHRWKPCSCWLCGAFLGWGFQEEAPKTKEQRELEAKFERRAKRRQRRRKQEEDKIRQEKAGEPPSANPEVISDDSSDEGDVCHVYIVPDYEIPPAFVGLITQHCRACEDYPLAKLEKMIRTSLRRHQHSFALNEFRRMFFERLAPYSLGDPHLQLLIDMHQRCRATVLDALTEGVTWPSYHPFDWEDHVLPYSDTSSDDSSEDENPKPLSVSIRLLPHQLSAEERDQIEDWYYVLTLLPKTFYGLFLNLLSLPLLQEEELKIERHEDNTTVLSYGNEETDSNVGSA